jgi:hypothetical protein
MIGSFSSGVFWGGRKNKKGRWESGLFQGEQGAGLVLVWPPGQGRAPCCRFAQGMDSTDGDNGLEGHDFPILPGTAQAVKRGVQNSSTS